MFSFMSPAGHGSWIGVAPCGADVGKGIHAAIVGSGPAGLAAAALLARDGHRVTLIDRFETPGPVGSGLMLQETGLAVLASLGVADRMISLGHRIDRLTGRDA